MTIIAFLKSNISPRAVMAVTAMTLLASVVMGRENPPPTVVALAAPATATRAVEEPAGDLDLQRLERSKNTQGVADLFAPRNPPPPPAAEVVSTEASAAPPAAPSAPPLPFTYLGQFIDGDKTEIFVARNGEHYSLEKGKTIEGQYKVDRITKTAVTFIYLPLGTRQKLAIPVLN
jgi:hypothetical protein